MTVPSPVYSGVIPPVVTPLTADGELDRASLDRVVGHLLDSGVNGLFALGSSGETAYLTPGRGDDGSFRRLVIGARGLPGFSVLTGHELVVDAMMLSGADGSVPGLGNVDPHGYVRLHGAAMKGDWATAGAEQDRLVGLFDIVRAARPGTASATAAGLGALDRKTTAPRPAREASVKTAGSSEVSTVKPSSSPSSRRAVRAAGIDVCR